MKLAYVFFNGELKGTPEFYHQFFKNQPGDFYCVDGGAHLMKELNIYPLELWGDFDSISENLLLELEAQGVKTKRFEKDKDFTDGDLMLAHLQEKNYEKIIIIGGLGGRKDHELSNLNLMMIYKNIEFLTQYERIFSIEKDTIIKNVKDKTLSFIPFSKIVKNVNLTGFKYPLNKRDIHQGETICMSNIALKNDVSISLESGILIAIIIN